MQVECDTTDSLTAVQAARHSSTHISSHSNAAGGDARCTASDHIISDATLDISAARRNSSGSLPSLMAQTATAPVVESATDKDLEACRNASGIATAGTNTKAAMINSKGDWSKPVNNIIRSYRCQAGPALPKPDTSQHDEVQEEVMIRSRIYKKLPWQVTVGHEAESLVVSNTYLGRLQLGVNTG